MNKSQELDALSRFIESLPRESYLRDALAESAPFFAAAIRADINFSFANRLIHCGRELREVQKSLQELRDAAWKEREHLGQLRRDIIRARGELSDAIADLENASNCASRALIDAKNRLKQSAA